MQKKKKTPTRRAAKSEAVSLQSVLKSVLLTLPIVTALALALLLLTTAVLLKTGDPDAYHTAAGLVLLYLVALFGGAISTRLHGRRTPLFCGIAMGAVMLLLLLVLSLALPDSGHAYNSALRVGQHALLFPVTIVGALLGAKEKKTPRRRTKS